MKWKPKADSTQSIQLIGAEKGDSCAHRFTHQPKRAMLISGRDFNKRILQLSLRVRWPAFTSGTDLCPIRKLKAHYGDTLPDQPLSNFTHKFAFRSCSSAVSKDNDWPSGRPFCNNERCSHWLLSYLRCAS